jgi:transcription antitermination factor NusA-like protein
MHKIELLIKNSNLTLFVLRKSEEEANKLFESLITAIETKKIQFLKLTCDRNPKTKLAVLSNDIIAINLTES